MKKLQIFFLDKTVISQNFMSKKSCTILHSVYCTSFIKKTRIRPKKKAPGSYICIEINKKTPTLKEIQLQIIFIYK